MQCVNTLALSPQNVLSVILKKDTICQNEDHPRIGGDLASAHYTTFYSVSIARSPLFSSLRNAPSAFVEMRRAKCGELYGLF